MDFQARGTIPYTAGVNVVGEGERGGLSGCGDTYTHMYTYVYIHKYMHTCMCVCVCVCVCVCIPHTGVRTTFITDVRPFLIIFSITLNA